jgi:hypothetical protein
MTPPQQRLDEVGLAEGRKDGSCGPQKVMLRSIWERLAPKPFSLCITVPFPIFSCCHRHLLSSPPRLVWRCGRILGLVPVPLRRYSSTLFHGALPGTLPILLCGVLSATSCLVLFEPDQTKPPSPTSTHPPYSHSQNPLSPLYSPFPKPPARSSPPPIRNSHRSTCLHLSLLKVRAHPPKRNYPAALLSASNPCPHPPSPQPPTSASDSRCHREFYDLQSGC